MTQNNRTAKSLQPRVNKFHPHTVLKIYQPCPITYRLPVHRCPAATSNWRNFYRSPNGLSTPPPLRPPFSSRRSRVLLKSPIGPAVPITGKEDVSPPHDEGYLQNPPGPSVEEPANDDLLFPIVLSPPSYQPGPSAQMDPHSAVTKPPPGSPSAYARADIPSVPPWVSCQPRTTYGGKPSRYPNRSPRPSQLWCGPIWSIGIIRLRPIRFRLRL